MNKIDVTAECSFTYGVQKKHAFTSKPKSIICKSVKDNVSCAYGSKCIFTHYADEVHPNACTFGYNCALIKYKGDNVKNKNMKKTCNFIHPEESVSDWLLRNGFDESLMQRPVKDPEVFKCTRMCISVLEKIPCAKGDECTYAHSAEELKTIPCNFGSECKHIRKDGTEYLNNDTGKICVFIHPDESLCNFESRALRSLAKTKKIKTETKCENSIEFPLLAQKMIYIPETIPEAISDSIPEAIQEPIAEAFPLESFQAQDKIVLNVPHHMAVEMLEILLKNGKTNIELNIY